MHHALGLLLVRRKRPGEALAELGRAAAAEPGDPGFAYAYAVALHSAGRVDDALAALRAAQQRSPGARQLLPRWRPINRERGALREAREWARLLARGGAGRPGGRRRSRRARGARTAAERGRAQPGRRAMARRSCRDAGLGP